MTRNGLPAIHPATHPSRETIALMPDAAPTGTGQRKPDSAHRRNVKMQPTTALRPTWRKDQTGRHPPAKLRANPKSP